MSAVRVEGAWEYMAAPFSFSYTPKIQRSDFPKIAFCHILGKPIWTRVAIVPGVSIHREVLLFWLTPLLTPDLHSLPPPRAVNKDLPSHTEACHDHPLKKPRERDGGRNKKVAHVWGRGLCAQLTWSTRIWRTFLEAANWTRVLFTRGMSFEFFCTTPSKIQSVL
jgi:hypothetical protein